MSDVIDFPKIKELLEELNNYIVEDEERRIYQEWLTKEINKYGDGKTPESRHNRMLFVNELMKDKIRALNKTLLNYKKELEDVKKKIEDYKNDNE
jgi:mannose-6-phosphate isomerase class I